MPSTFGLTGFGFLGAILVVTIWHELGHLVAARAQGIPVRLIAVGVGPAIWRRALSSTLSVELRAVPVGMAVGVTGRRNADGGLRRPVQHDMAMAAAGPVASFLLLLPLLALALTSRSHPAILYWAVATGGLSAFLGAANLMPLPGLDGGHLLVLTLNRLGLQLRPQFEARLHRVGLQALTLICALVLVAQRL